MCNNKEEKRREEWFQSYGHWAGIMQHFNLHKVRHRRPKEKRRGKQKCPRMQIEQRERLGLYG